MGVTFYHAHVLAKNWNVTKQMGMTSYASQNRGKLVSILKLDCTRQIATFCNAHFFAKSWNVIRKQIGLANKENLKKYALSEREKLVSILKLVCTRLKIGSKQAFLKSSQAP